MYVCPCLPQHVQNIVPLTGLSLLHDRHSLRPRLSKQGHQVRTSGPISILHPMLPMLPLLHTVKPLLDSLRPSRKLRN